MGLRDLILADDFDAKTKAMGEPGLVHDGPKTTKVSFLTMRRQNSTGAGRTQSRNRPSCSPSHSPRRSHCNMLITNHGRPKLDNCIFRDTQNHIDMGISDNAKKKKKRYNSGTSGVQREMRNNVLLYQAEQNSRVLLRNGKNTAGVR